MDTATVLAILDGWDPPPYFGAVLGASCGVAGGLIGTLLGVLGPRGRLKGLVLALGYAAIAFGAVCLALGIVALADGREYALWYPLLLVGGITTVVVGSLLPVMHRVYRMAEARRLQAEEFRRGAGGAPPGH